MVIITHLNHQRLIGHAHAFHLNTATASIACNPIMMTNLQLTINTNLHKNPLNKTTKVLFKGQQVEKHFPQLPQVAVLSWFDGHVWQTCLRASDLSCPCWNSGAPRRQLVSDVHNGRDSLIEQTQPAQGKIKESSTFRVLDHVGFFFLLWTKALLFGAQKLKSIERLLKKKYLLYFLIPWVKLKLARDPPISKECFNHVHGQL